MAAPAVLFRDFYPHPAQPEEVGEQSLVEDSLGVHLAHQRLNALAGKLAHRRGKKFLVGGKDGERGTFDFSVLGQCGLLLVIARPILAGKKCRSLVAEFTLSNAEGLGMTNRNLLACRKPKPRWELRLRRSCFHVRMVRSQVWTPVKVNSCLCVVFQFLAMLITYREH